MGARENEYNWLFTYCLLAPSPASSFLLCDAETGTAKLISLNLLSAGFLYGLVNTRQERENAMGGEEEETSFWFPLSVSIIPIAAQADVSPQLLSTLAAPATLATAGALAAEQHSA